MPESVAAPVALLVLAESVQCGVVVAGFAMAGDCAGQAAPVARARLVAAVPVAPIQSDSPLVALPRWHQMAAAVHHEQEAQWHSLEVAWAHVVHVVHVALVVHRGWMGQPHCDLWYDQCEHTLKKQE